jgi:hypothetical protein
MNVQCLNCKNIRTEARLTGGCATPMFGCPFQNQRATHLMPGAKLKCHEDRDGKLIDQKSFEPDYSTVKHG